MKPNSKSLEVEKLLKTKVTNKKDAKALLVKLKGARKSLVKRITKNAVKLTYSTNAAELKK